MSTEPSPNADSVFTDSQGTWITEEGWTRRERDGRPAYVRCVCDAPVDRTKDGLCEECLAVSDGEDT